MSRLLPRRAGLGVLGADISVMPVGDLPGWKQVAAEDFNDDVPIGGFTTSSNSGNLTPAGSGYALYKDRISTYPDGWSDTSGNAQYYPSKTLSTANSYLDMYHYTDTINGSPTALGAQVHVKRPDGNYNQVYGRWTMRMRAYNMTGPNYGAVALAIGSSWPAGGELDWPEGDLTGAIKGNYHYANASGGVQPVDGLGKVWADWHVFTTEWSPGLVRWYVDGALALSTTNQTPPASNPMGYGVQSGSTGGVPDPSVTGHLQIDWICVYDYAAT